LMYHINVINSERQIRLLNEKIRTDGNVQGKKKKKKER
jgi:hypothetical protein